MTSSNINTSVATHVAHTPNMHNAVVDDPRWQAVISRDKSADGQFVYGVITTGIYCRPGCGSRLPLPEHVRFFENPLAAELAGLRACKRCKPNVSTDRYSEIVTQACRMLESQDTEPDLDQLAKSVNLSKHHFQKIFKQQLGLTPKAYAQAQRAERLRVQLSKGAAVTDAIYAAGYNAPSRFYEQADEVLGMSASDYRNEGNQQKIHFAVGECSLGSILVAKTELGLCAILLGDEPAALVEDLQHRFARAELIGADEEFEKWVAQVIGFVESPALGLNLPLDIRGTAFQQRVWQALRDIPVGETASYTDIAKRIGAPKAFRAVAQACGANALAVAIPCHRVVRNDGGLSGYRWGVERKRALLQHECESMQH